MTRSDPGGQPPGSAAAAELEAVHAVTRWLVGASASALAILLAGVRLSALGQLASDQPERLAVAVIACAVALLAAGITLVLAARVLVSPGWTLSKLAHLDAHHRWQSHPLQPALEAQRGLLTPDDDLQPARLYRRHRRLYVAWFQLQERGCTTLPDDLYAEQNDTEQDYSVACPAATLKPEAHYTRIQGWIDSSRNSLRTGTAHRIADTLGHLTPRLARPLNSDVI